jgi:hypothetical protein
MKNTTLSACLWFALCLFLTGAGNARADSISGTLFKEVKGAIVGAVPPDAIEMARFSISHPAEAATVYSRAAAQDYPFFGLIGAAKAAKNRDLPGIDTFTMAKCMSPITAIDSVFSKADSTITSAQGKASTNAAMATAAGIAASYAKAQSDQAKQQLVEQLTQSVPYFGDIGTICLFAFETDLQAEKDLNLIASQISQDIRSAYFAFKSGDVVTGAEILISLGAGKDIVCTMVDNAVGGGIIGRTPVLGSLAKGACSGFVGAVIDGVKGIINGGVGLAEKGVGALAGAGKAAFCAVYSIFGNGCSSSEPPPPTGLSNGNAWCAARGGMASFLSKTNQPDDYSVICGDGSKCRVKPGGDAACATAAELAAHRAQQIALAEADFKANLPQWQAEFDSRWLNKCVDEACKTALAIVRLNATLMVKQAHEADPTTSYFMATVLVFEAADRQAAAVIDDASYRVMPAKWAAQFNARGNSDCEDEVCRMGMKFVALNAMLQVQQRGAMTPRPPYAGASTIYAAAENQRATLLAESAKRAVDFNKTNTANAGAAWEILTNAIWGKLCADAPCLTEVKQLSAQMRIAANLVQLAHPEESSMKVQGTVGPEYGKKFQAAINASKERVAKQTPVVPLQLAHPVGPLQPFMQRAHFPVTEPFPSGNGRPTTGGRPPPQQPAPTGGRPAPTRPAGKTMTMQAGTDRMGGDFRSLALERPDPQQCRQACIDDAACHSYTYVNPGLKGPQAMCFLKNTVPPATPSACCTSGEVVGEARR